MRLKIEVIGNVKIWFFDFFHQCLIVFCIQLFCLLRQVYSQVFYSFSYNGEWNCFLNFSFWFFIVRVQECKGFLCINFISCHFTIFIGQLQSFSGCVFRVSMYGIMSFANSESLQVKTTLRYHLTPLRMAFIKKIYKQHMMERMWRKGNHLAQLVGI